MWFRGFPCVVTMLIIMHNLCIVGFINVYISAMLIWICCFIKCLKSGLSVNSDVRKV
jgi:hypothetical protein